MGGKTGTTTQSTQIPPEVLARYNSVNATAEKAASQPFQQYSTDPNAFVAGINAQQQAGISGINQYANAAQPGYQQGMAATQDAQNLISQNQNVYQPYYNAALGTTNQALNQATQYANAAQPGYQAAMAGTADVSQGYNAPNYQAGVQGYMNPYLQNAVSATTAQMQNVNQQQQQQMLGSSIGQGAFGGDRANIGLANLENQQNLALGQTIGGMENQGYQAAAQNYMAGLGQQGALANQYGQLAGQAQNAAMQAAQLQGQLGAQYGQLGTGAQAAAYSGVPLALAAGAQYGQLGAGAQAAGLAGAQAQIGAGTLGQQTEQAGKTALYNQFLQQQSYPFQIAQFLANIAEGTGSLSGSNTTTTQPMSFFGSDERIKHDIKRVGTADNGLPIYTFKYKGDPAEQTHIGFMAQEVEKVHPEAVAEDKHGIKYVNYDRAARAEGGLVGPQHEGMGFGLGGREHHAYGDAVGSSDYYDPNSIQNILTRHQNMYANIDAHHVPMARDLAGGIGKHGRVPQGNLPIGSLMKSGPAPQLPQDDILNRAQQLSNLADTGTKYYDKYKQWQAQKDQQQNSAAARQDAERATTDTAPVGQSKLGATEPGLIPQATGGRIHRDVGGKTPEGLYSDDTGGSLDIPNDKSSYKLDQKPTLPGSMQDPTMRDLMAIAALIPKAFGGSAGREHHDGEEGNVVGQSILEKALGINDQPSVKNDRVSNTALGLPTPTQRGAPEEVSPEAQKASPNFARAVSRTLQFEGGLNPKDTNGTPSKFGINQEANPDVYDKINTPSDASQVYYNRYWKPLGADQMDPNLAHVAFDTAVIAGVGKTRELLAQANGDPEKLLQLRKEFQDGLISKDPAKYGKYQQSWNNRVDQLRTDIGNKLDLPQQQQQGLGAVAPKEDKKGGLGDLFTAENVVPVLTGLAGMASSRSPFLGSAILEGLGAGAQSYMGTQKSLAEIAQAKAATSSIEADTIKGSLVTTRLGSYVWVKTPNGLRSIPYNKYDAMPEGQKPPLAFAPPDAIKIIESTYGGGAETPAPTVQPNAATPDVAAEAPGKIPTNFNYDNISDSAASNDRNMLDPLKIGEDAGKKLIDSSGKYYDNIKNQAQAARNTAQSFREMATNLATGTTLKGVAAPGTGFSGRAFITGAINTFARMAGVPENQIQGGENQDAVQKKLNAIQGALTSSGANQNSLAAFNQLMSANPNLDMPPDAYGPLMSLMLVQNMRSTDADEHLNNWAKKSNGTFFGTAKDFERKTAQRYADEQNAISDLLTKTPNNFIDMMNGRDKNGNVLSPEMIEDALSKHYGIKGLSRYFVRGV